MQSHHVQVLTKLTKHYSKYWKVNKNFVTKQNWINWRLVFGAFLTDPEREDFADALKAALREGCAPAV